MADSQLSILKSPSEPFAAARNACKLCAPLGACLAFRGIEGSVPFLHGSQGCATYIRRYMISHYREPIDIACSNFGEAAAVFGGKENLRTGLENVIRQYRPRLIGIATTCLAETIGDDVSLFLSHIRNELDVPALPALVPASTPSYAGTHAEGFQAAVRAMIETLAEDGPSHGGVGLLPGMVSPADIRYLREIFSDFGLSVTIAPDYSDTLDGGTWTEYRQIPPGGTPVESLRSLGAAAACVEFTATGNPAETGGSLLESRHRVPRFAMPLPIGVCATDRLFDALETLAGRPTPGPHSAERGRLVDAMIDAHKYVFGKRAVVYGEPDLVAGIAGLLAEIGIVPALCATGGATGRLREAVTAAAPDAASKTVVLENVDFADIEEHAAEMEIDLIIGNSKGFKLSQKLDVPLIRIGFPIHDRIGGARILHVGYRGTQQLFDRIANALIAAKQDASPVGYTYM